jgi:hypothetical protein
MMNFRTVKNSVINKVLTPNMGSNFRVVGWQKQALSAEEIAGNARLVSVYTTTLDFSGRETGPVQNKPMLNIDLFVSSPAKTNLAVLDNPASTTAQRAAAMAASLDAAKNADDSMDELIDLVWNILMNARYNQLALDEVVGSYPVDTGVKIAERFISRIDKDQPVEQGEYVVLTARMQLTYKVAEQVNSAAVVAMTEGIQDGWQFANKDGENIDTYTKTGVTTP